MKSACCASHSPRSALRKFAPTKLEALRVAPPSSSPRCPCVFSQSIYDLTADAASSSAGKAVAAYIFLSSRLCKRTCYSTLLQVCWSKETCQVRRGGDRSRMEGIASRSVLSRRRTKSGSASSRAAASSAGEGSCVIQSSHPSRVSYSMRSLRSASLMSCLLGHATTNGFPGSSPVFHLPKRVVRHRIRLRWFRLCIQYLP